MRCFLLLSFMAVSVTSCSFSNEPVEEGLKSENERIVFGESIDGVNIEDSETIVIQKLGEPDGIWHGNFAGRVFDYTQGAHAGMTVTIYTRGGVKGVEAYSPYAGTTIEGIGLGSSIEEARRSLGEPTDSYEDLQGDPGDYYHFGNLFFLIDYEDEKMTSMVMRATTR